MVSQHRFFTESLCRGARIKIPKESSKALSYGNSLGIACLDLKRPDNLALFICTLLYRIVSSSFTSSYSIIKVLIATAVVKVKKKLRNTQST